MADETTVYDPHVAEAVLDAFEAICGQMDPPTPCAFEELSAEPGDMPRVMLKPMPAQSYERRYISGEAIRSMPFSATLRIRATEAEQDRLDARQWLQDAASAFEDAAVAAEGLTPYMQRQATVPTCLGRTERFEDWQVTFDFKYKQAI